MKPFFGYLVLTLALTASWVTFPEAMVVITIVSLVAAAVHIAYLTERSNGR